MMDPVIELKNTISRSTREAERRCDVCEALENAMIFVGDLQNFGFQARKRIGFS
jgi:hypothetical protein